MRCYDKAIVLLINLSVLFAFSSGAIRKSDGPEWERHLRLSPDVYPLHYRLHLHPDFDQGTFTG